MVNIHGLLVFGKNLTSWQTIFIALERRVDAFQKAAQLGDVTIRDEFDPTFIFHHLHFLSGPEPHGPPYRQWYDDLKFG
jgi:hypothetical protein